MFKILYNFIKCYYQTFNQTVVLTTNVLPSSFYLEQMFQIICHFFWHFKTLVSTRMTNEKSKVEQFSKKFKKKDEKNLHWYSVTNAFAYTSTISFAIHLENFFLRLHHCGHRLSYADRLSGYKIR